MRIVVDENIPDAASVFGAFGDVSCLPGRRIDAAAVRTADVLIVRSVTPVDAALLAGSRVRFVGSTTAGVDHVRQEDLARLGIRFAAAPGSNADSVVDYVLAALALAFPRAQDIAGRRVGIVGCGAVGSRLLARLRALGIACRVFDPFIAPVAEAASFAEVLGCDVLTVHVPLTRSGPHPTWHLLGAPELARLGDDAVLINAARGGVIDSPALLAALIARPRRRAVLDVWEDEPGIDPALLQRCLAGTAHIAGYAVDGKRRGVAMVYEALRDFLGHGAPGASLPALASPPAGTIAVAATGAADWQHPVTVAYDLRRDADALAAGVRARPDAVAAVFDGLRRDYPERREFSAWRVADTVPAAARAQWRAAGFTA